MPLALESLTASKVALLPKAQTVFFFAVGPLEDHGPHLPLALDLREALELARLAAERLEREKPGWVGVLMPAVPLGIDSNTTSLAITVRAHVLRDWLVDACLGLFRQGFLHFACFSGHPGPKQLTAIEEAGKFLRHRAGGGFPMRWLRPRRKLPTLVSVSSALVEPGAVRSSPLWPDPAEHGGSRDTSVALAIDVAGLDAIYTALPATPREGRPIARLWRRKLRRVSGYWGEPARASAQLGERTLNGQLEDVFPKLRAVWEGSNPEGLFRSWYSLFPSNRSFFKAWVLATALAVLLAFWIFLQVQGLFGS